MTGLTLGLTLGPGLAILGLHMAAVALTKALRTYSRSRLEELCEDRGHPERADEIAHLDARTERAAEALAVLTGLGLAALLGTIVDRVEPQVATAEAVVAIALTVAAAGYVTAGVLGRVLAEAVLDAMWPATAALRAVMAPFTVTLRGIESFAERRARRATGAPRPPSVEVELHLDPDQSPEEVEADLDEPTRDMLEHVVELAQTDVAAVMTPRKAILALPATVTAREAAAVFVESGRSRIPLYGESRDDIVGILYAKDLFARLVSGEPDIAPQKLARPAYFVPETKSARELLEEFRTRRVQLAIVLDEYGGVAGLVTLEDLIEELVGPIEDEHDAPAPHDPIVAVGEATYEVDAALDLEELNERLDLHLPTGGEFQTVGGFVFNALGHLPEPGDSFRHNGVEFIVLEVTDRSIRRLRIDLHPAAAVSAQA
ncbi:MAG: HlyC/CorC family transporter [Isosphaeraceae bacterium]|nr:HlyC/CorC family transporter [Isosphaeraceae bacterium]